MKKTYLKIAGVLNLLTAIAHLFGGRLDLINPLVASDLTVQAKGELVAVWHIVTIQLFITSYVLLKAGFGKLDATEGSLLRFLGVFYVLIGLPFIAVSFWYSIFAPQWILLIPIGALVLFGLKNQLVNE